MCQFAPRSCSVFTLANAFALWQITIPSDHLPILLTLKLEQPNFGEKIILRLFQDYLRILPLPEIPQQAVLRLEDQFIIKGKMFEGAIIPAASVRLEVQPEIERQLDTMKLDDIFPLSFSIEG